MADRDSQKPGQAVAERDTAPSIPDSIDKTVIRDASEPEETPQRPQYPPPYLVVLDGPRTGARFPLKDGANIVGRAPGNEIRLDDQSVSRQHSEISHGPSGWMVKDLGSKNGTLVNGKQVTDPVVIGHKDVVKSGIYQLRLILMPIPLEEELTLPPELAQLDRTVFVSAPPESLTAGLPRDELSEPSIPPEAMPPGGEGGAGVAPKRRLGLKLGIKLDKRTIVMVGVLLAVGIPTLAYLGTRIFSGPTRHAVKTAGKSLAAAQQAAGTEAAIPPPVQPPAEGATPPIGPEAAVTPPATATQPPMIPPAQPPPAAPPGTPAVPPTPGTPPIAGQQPPMPPAVPGTPAAQKIPVFLDFASSPMPARVTFQGQEVGTTPLRVNAQLEPGRPEEAQALFVMPEIQQQYTQKVDFKAEIGTSVIPVLFRGPIGMLKINELPRDVEFYLEGKFSYDRFNEQSAKLREIILQKPIYVPFGHYMIELRRSRQLGTTSTTFIPDIIYHREIDIAEDSPTFTVDVKEEDLKSFPVKVRSEPANADVFVDGKAVGKTPFEGAFPLGDHRLVLQKEGYFEHAEDLKVDINTPFVANVTLKTSVAGAHLNNAKQAMGRQMYQEAINELAQVLSSNPAPSETAQANLLLGKAYFALGDLDRSQAYFEQARQSEEQRYAAMLGLVNCYAVRQQNDKALPLLVEVMLKNKDEAVKREANALFQKLSPFRSVIYIYSDPPGARVVVNDKVVAQPTPVILHDLPLGNYRIHLERAGFLPSDLNISLSVNEFNPVVVKLKPMPQ